ncbi:MAG TPA: hypothetical protein VGE98_03985 [Thermoanaerobaculia bacterium]
MNHVSGIGKLAVLAVAASLALAPTAHAANTAKQTPPIQLGTSGGSVNDLTTQFCCGGTLGSLVKRDGTSFILSNNHVLARSGSAATGEDIVQPGLIENGCSSTGLNRVADYAGNIVPLGTHNVDTALATVRAGQVTTTGQILGIGVPCNTTASPTVGLSVKKAGRTTGLTTGRIQATNVSVTIQYETQCNGGSTFNETYTNQVSITPGSFSAGGDSGSLILSSTNHPVALLYAGSSQVTIGNRIADVVAAYTSGGHTFSFVGNTCAALAADELLAGPSPVEVAFAKSVKEQHEAELFARPGVLGVGVGKVDDEADTTETAIVVYVESTRASAPRNLPKELDGIKVRIIPTDPFVAR